MLLSTASVIALFASVANAHFHLQYPLPRGLFVANDEPKYCDGYTEATSNRTSFPLSGGFVTFKSGHPDWTIGITVSSKSNPTSFDDFSKTLAVDFFKGSGSGQDDICIPLNFNATQIDGVKDGADVTIQVQYSAGDGDLFQCADLTLSSNATIPSNVTCPHPVDTSAKATATSPSASSPSETGKKDNGATHLSASPAIAVILGALVASLL